MDVLEPELLAWRVFAILFSFAFVALVVLIIRAMFRKPEAKFRHIYAGVETFTEPVPGSVFVRFHTYDGFLLWATQHEHAFHAVPEQARELLRRLHRYNLTHGVFVHGALVIPFMSYFNYKAQLRSITAQEVDATFVDWVSGNADDSLPNVAAVAAQRARQRTWFHALFGWIAAALGAVFRVVAVVLLTQREWETAIGGIVIGLLLASVGRDWLRHSLV